MRNKMLAVAIAATLGGCGGKASVLIDHPDPVTETDTFLKRLAKRPPPPVEPLSVIEKPVSRKRSLSLAETPRDPFYAFGAHTQAKETSEEDAEWTGPKPDPNRKHEPLEQYEFDSLTYVGVLKEKDKKWALIMTPQHTLVPVTEGNYLGKHDGRIVAITDTSVEVEALFPTAPGRWEKRRLNMRLAGDSVVPFPGHQTYSTEPNS